MPLSKKKMSRPRAQEKSMGPKVYNPAKESKSLDHTNGTSTYSGGGSTKKDRSKAVKTAIKAQVKSDASEAKSPSMAVDGPSMATKRASDKAAVAGKKGAPMRGGYIGSERGTNSLKLGSGQQKTVAKRVAQSVKATTPAKKKK